MRAFIEFLIGLVDRMSGVLAAVAVLLTAGMIGAMLYEVAARHFFGAPTIWSNDISYMLNGAVFMLGAAYTLRHDGHVRIDVLQQMMPHRLRHALQALFYLLLFAPILWMALEFAWTRTLRAYMRGSLETASAWEPLIWPFLTGLTVGLAALFVQVIAEAIRHAFAVWDGPRDAPAPGAR
ncbi:MAG: TRAP transporter small permease subunit [Alphaproteobacteria bacterium]|nr:TRAP transporter small permease subunit [Alphaproteobacteria bacterium]MDX5370706.1 TRAP transporter small permease subunit [Alphaproteobacteria bacterium]MDX5465123.1 TRAP transporter small permease subunit [Alphaproteobacteria bacterium]